MTPTQREAALLLADELQRFDGAERESLRDEAAALLRELLAEPVQEPVAWIHRAQYLLAHAENSPPADKMLENGWEPLYAAPQQRKPLTPSMQAEVECDCLVAWNASTYGHSAQDTVHPMFLSAFISGYRAAERAHGITGEPT